MRNMIRLITMLSIMSMVCCQYPRHRAPPPEQESPPPQAYQDDHEYRPIPPRNNVIHKPAPVHYVNIGAELAGDYKFGYDTGKGNDGQSFREETRLPDGSVRGAYGYVDGSGRQRIVKYTAGKDGYKVEGDGASEAQSRAAQSRPEPQPAYRQPEPAYEPPAPAPQAYRPPPQQAYRSQPQEAYRAPAAPQQSYRPPPQPARAPPAQNSPPSQPAYRAPPPQPAYRAPPAPPAPRRSYAPQPQRPAPRREYAPVNRESDYDYPDNEVTERRLAPIDTSLLNYNIGTSHGDGDQH